MYVTKELFDLSKTIAAPLLENTKYPWEALGSVGEFILETGKTLSPDEYDNPQDGVWIAKDAKVYPTAYINGPCIICAGAEIRHCAFIRGNAVIGKKAREAGLDIMTYSGFTYEHLIKKAETESSVRELLAATNYLVDGRYVEAQRDLNLRFRGSKNQRILDVTCYPNSTDASVIEFE